MLDKIMFENKLIDLFSNVDMSLVETDYPDEDIENLKFQEEKSESFWKNKKVRRVTEVGIIAASITTGIIVAIKIIRKRKAA